MTTPSYYSILTAKVRYAPISSSAKILYSEITALAQVAGYCYASNQYFSELYNVEERQIRRWLRELVLLGVVKVNRGQKRKIYIVDSSFLLTLPVFKDREAVKKDRVGRSFLTERAVKKDLHNNTSNNTSLVRDKNDDSWRGRRFIESLEKNFSETTIKKIKNARIGESMSFRATNLNLIERTVIESQGGEIVEISEVAK